MKKILVLVVLLFNILPFLQTNAFETRFGENINLTEELNEDLYVAGGEVDIEAPVNGDLIISGGRLNILSDIAEDLIIAGGEIIISGNIGDDVRAAGGQVKISSNVNGDLVIGAGDVTIEKGVIVDGDLLVGAGKIILDGVIKGNAKIRAGQLIQNGVINGNADFIIEDYKNPDNTGKINGSLNYKSNQKINALENITSGEINFDQSFIKKETRNKIIKSFTSYLFFKIIWLFVFASILYFTFKKLFINISDNLRNKTGKSFLYGFLVIIGFPIVIFLLFITIIGIPFAFAFLFAYIFLFVFLALINVMVFSSFFISKYNIDNIYLQLLIIFALTLPFGLINGINLVAGFFTIGAILIKKFEIIGDLRK